MFLEISQLLAHHARYRPQHTAVIFEEHRYTYAEYNRRVNRLANALLRLGIQKGDKLASFTGNCLPMLDLYWAAAKIGAVVVPLSNLLRGQGLRSLLNDSDSVFIMTNSDYVDALNAIREDLAHVQQFVIAEGAAQGYTTYDELVADASDENPPHPGVTGDDIYNIIYSSGTTGLPKGILISHRVRALYGSLFSLSYRMTPESVMLHTGAIIFNGAFLTLMPAFYLGATYILHRNFDAARLIETVQQEKVTHIKMVPSQIIAMLNHPTFDPDTMRSLHMLGTVGAPLHMRYKQRLAEALPGTFYELYGLTEGFMTILDPYQFEHKPESVGVPPPLMHMRIVDNDGNDLQPGQIGEIVGQSPLLMSGYYKRPDLTAQTIKNGWLHSGDLGYVDADGYLYLVDRKKDMIISGGVNVYPRDMEEVMVKHPAVREVAIFGVPDEKWGETPVAAVVKSPDVEIDPDSLRDWANEHVEARYQKINRVIFLEDFPRSASGKTLKRSIKQQYLEQEQRPDDEA